MDMVRRQQIVQGHKVDSEDGVRLSASIYFFVVCQLGYETIR